MAIPPDAMIPRNVFHRYYPGESTAKMAVGLVGGVLFATGHHSFYLSLQGKPPPETMISLWGMSGGISYQQINFALGTFFAFMVKVFLGLAISVSQEQWSWNAAKSRPSRLSLLDNLFASRTNLVSVLSARLWGRFPVPMFLALFIW